MKKLLAKICALTLILGCFTTTAFAMEDMAEPVTVETVETVEAPVEETVESLAVIFETEETTSSAPESVVYSEDADREGWTAISTAAELKAISGTSTTARSGWYYLTADIDLEGVTFTTLFPYSYYPFNGTFDGNGYTISNMTITSGTAGSSSSLINGVGLFGCCDGATITNVRVENAYITNSAAYTAAGIIVGKNYNTTITDCVTSGYIYHNQTLGVGGIAGYSYYKSGSSSSSGSIERCASSATVTSYSVVGGIAGNMTIPVSECYFTGEAISTSGIAGGVVGSTSSTVKNCWSSGYVSGNNSAYTKPVGGIVADGGSVYDSYTIADVNTLNTATTSTAIGRVAQPAVGSGSDYDVFFEVGHFTIKSVASTLWDTSTSSYLNGTACTVEEMQTPSTFSSAGWDEDIWLLEEGEYPQLINAPSLEKEVATTCTVTYATGDVTATMPDADTVAVGTDLTLPTASATGYVLTGWSDGTTTYTTTYPVSEDITLIAQWAVDKDGNGTADSAEPCTVTFDVALDGETVTGYDATKTVDKNTVITLEAPTHENTDNWTYYVFLNWLLGTETIEAGAEYTVTENVEFTAQWEKITVNGDDIWDYLDAMSIMDHLGGITPTTFVEDLADRNDDGWIDYLDAMTIMDHMA